MRNLILLTILYFSVAKVSALTNELSISENIEDQLALAVQPNEEELQSQKNKGLEAAKEHISKNRLYVYYLPQFPTSEEWQYEEFKAKILKKYHIYGKPVSCVYYPGQAAYEKAYDEAMESEVIKRYGEGFLEKINIEIENKYAKSKH